jgi:hypothetical protein
MLTAAPSGRLLGMASVSVAAIAVSLVVPFVSGFIERGVLRRERTEEPAVKIAAV